MDSDEKMGQVGNQPIEIGCRSLVWWDSQPAGGQSV